MSQHNENDDSSEWLEEKAETENDTRKFHAPPRSTSFFDRILGRKSQSPSPSPSPGSRSSTVSYRESSLPPLSPLTLKGYKRSTRNRILDAELAENIRNLLPARTQLYDEWELVYSLEQHGISLKTLYRNCDPRYQREQSKKKKAESGFADGVIRNMIVGSNTNSQDTTQRSQGYVLVIKDEKGNKFGSFLNENLKPVDTKRYYGNGECFLWKCENYHPGNLSHSNNSSEKSDAFDGETIAQDVPSAAKEGGRDTKVSTRFKAFMYTGINASIIYSNQHFIAIGSSDGHNGLWIDQSLYNGVSCVCETFGNEVLNDSDPHSKVGKFKIMNLEVWRVGAL